MKTIQGWPPRWLTKTAAAEMRRGDGTYASDWIDGMCRVTKDTVAGRTGEPLALHGWQQALVSSLLAVKADGRRRYREALIGMPRKNGKSALGSALALFALVEGDGGTEVYSCAGDRDQARIVFGMAKRMVELDPELTREIKIYRDVLEVVSRGSVYRALSSEAYTKEGLSPNFVVFDEVHVQPSDELWDVMTLGSGARLDPLVLGITTAGSRTDTRGGDTLCYRKYQYGKRVAAGEIDDPSFFFAWWEPTLGVKADHRDPSTWAESNPGYGTICSVEDFESTVMRTPENEFRTKRTNVWVTSTDSALPHGAWDACGDRNVTVATDDEVVLFFDGSWAADSTGIVGCTVTEVPHLFVVDLWEKLDDADWRVPIPEVEERLRRACLDHNVIEISCDPYRWQRSIQALEDEGLPVIEFPNTIPRIVPAWQSFYEAVLDRRLTHDGDPRLARHIENMVLKRDARGTRPVKESKSSRRHIDLGICAMGSHSRAIARRTQGPGLLAAWA